MQPVTLPQTRRGFLSGGLAAGADLLLSRQPRFSRPAEEDGSSFRTSLADDPRRPNFHLLPARNWMNDPNGPIYFDGRYHMFFQSNPLGAVWGNMSWSHAVSTDMLHWKHLPVALRPTPEGPDSFGVFSGSTIQVGSRVYAVFTGTRESTRELATIKDGLDHVQESQCLAWSDDPSLTKWTKGSQPIIPLPPPGMKITGFRDPSVWRQGEWFYMTVGSGKALNGGCVLLYRSKEMKKWEYLHELASGSWNGKRTTNPCDDGEMWECPDFFELDGGHVLIYSTLGMVFWQSGTLDEATMRFTPVRTGMLDLDAFYAPKTQLDAQGRRILWGWIPERRSEDEMRKAGWSGMMSLPRLMNLDRDGMLRLQVLPQVSALRSGPVRASAHGSGQRFTLEHASGEVSCKGHANAALELTMSAGLKPLLRVSYSPETRIINVDGKEFALQAGDQPSLHAFVDGSVIELILSGRIGYTKRFYYPETMAPEIAVKISGAELRAEAWKVAPISQDRLTTPATV